MAAGRIELKVSPPDEDVAYVSLPDHPGKGTPGVVVRQVRLRDIMNAYGGPDLYFDFDQENRLIGIEILA
jgi:hypothetical protein